MAAEMRIVEAPGEAERLAILGPLMAFNAENGFPSDHGIVAILLEEAGATLGGLWGTTGYGWLFVAYLAVPEALRGGGWGTRLLGEAERIAQARGCVGAWLTTFSFQARGFYEKLGYSLFAELEDSPPGNTRLFLRKRFADES